MGGPPPAWLLVLALVRGDEELESGKGRGEKGECALDSQGISIAGAPLC